MTVKLQVLGTGCTKCDELAIRTEQAARELGLDYELIKVDRLEEIMKFGVMMTPALAVNGEVKVTGKVPSVEKLKDYLR